MIDSVSSGLDFATWFTFLTMPLSRWRFSLAVRSLC